MKKRSSIALLVLFLTAIQSKAQTPFSTMDSVNINNINAAVLVHGDMWWNPADTNTAHCYFPADSLTDISGAGALWMSGYDAGSQLHIAAQTYRQDGNDYWPGPLDASGSLSYTTSQNWAKIWKVNRSDIQYFQGLSTHTTANTPQAILTWPAKGNVNAQGNGGVSLTVTDDMAPFVDLNGNGIYEPLLGEYPDVKGDQALWWVFSDNGPAHTQTNGTPLGVEVHAMAYGYRRGTLIDNVIYYEYTIVNRSPNTYTDFRIAQWNMAQLGGDYNFFSGSYNAELVNYIGFDSTWRMGITYSAINDDGESGGGHPIGSFWDPPPMSAVTMIVLPGDAGSSYVPAGSFNYYNNDASAVGPPVIDTQYNNYMRSKNKVGAHLRDDFAGGGIPSTGYGTGPNCNYVFNGDPGNFSQWSECSCNNNPGDRRYVLSSNDFTLNSGASQKVVLALIATIHAGGCPVTSFDSIKVVADTAWDIYYNPLPPIPLATINVTASNTISIYPNPADDKLFIENAGNNTGEIYITVYNSIGQVMNVPVNKNGQVTEADVSRLPAGLYYILYRKGIEQKTATFVKDKNASHS